MANRMDRPVWTRVYFPDYWVNLTQVLECIYFRVHFEKFIDDANKHVVTELGFVSFYDDEYNHCELCVFSSIRNYNSGIETYYIAEENLTFCATVAAVRGLAVS